MLNMFAEGAAINPNVKLCRAVWKRNDILKLARINLLINLQTIPQKTGRRHKDRSLGAEKNLGYCSMLDTSKAVLK